MDNLEMTTLSEEADVITITIFDGNKEPEKVVLDNRKSQIVTFGRGSFNDIVLVSSLVSAEHGRFRYTENGWAIEDKAVFGDSPSTNGIIYNDASIVRRYISSGDIIRIDDGVETVKDGVMFAISSDPDSESWNTYDLSAQNEVRIGRENTCEICLQHVTVSRIHAIIRKENDGYTITDNNSTNGLIVNNRFINGSHQLHEKDVILIADTKLVYSCGKIYFCRFNNGISVDGSHIVIKRGKGKNAPVTGNDITINVSPGELVAIIGGSGAGKSTILNCLCGYLPPASGNVYINGANLYRNFDILKKIIGYVPQSDIVYDNLTVYDMLSYTAKLRLPDDTSREEIDGAINRALHIVELEEKKNSYIRSLSGGQKKRASIAVELLSDPNLIFLDEPASGLDPATERSLMNSLRKMADSGKTVILVTHSTLQLKMCDKIAFMGKGGNLCFFGTYEAALNFFGVTDVVDIYNMITQDAKSWRDKYDSTIDHIGNARKDKKTKVFKENKKNHLAVLCARYAKLVINDRLRLLLLLAQAPVLALLISLVASGKQFEQYEMTKSLLFALSCSAFWVGMLNAIQEICKERSILKREYMTGLPLLPYLLSKIIVLGVLCIVQSILIISVFAGFVGLPEEGVKIGAIAEMLITTILTAISSTAMGLFVSSLFKNADRAMTIAPIMLMPQILFSGLIFKLEGITEKISYLAICRWSMEGYGTTADLNSLELKLQQEGFSMIKHDPEDFYKFTFGHLFSDWMILIVFVVLFLGFSFIALRQISKEN